MHYFEPQKGIQSLVYAYGMTSIRTIALHALLMFNNCNITASIHIWGTQLHPLQSSGN